MVQGRRRRGCLGSGLPSRTRYRCTCPTQLCGSNRTYNNSHTPKPFPISFRNTCKQVPLILHNQPKILWRFSCTARLVTDPPFPSPLHSVLATPLFEQFFSLLTLLAIYCCWPLAFLFVPP